MGDGNEPNGAFYKEAQSGTIYEYPTPSGHGLLTKMNASRSSIIYGNSATVTPLSLSCKIVLKY